MFVPVLKVVLSRMKNKAIYPLQLDPPILWSVRPLRPQLPPVKYNITKERDRGEGFWSNILYR
jgi:hypothetical protein